MKDIIPIGSHVQAESELGKEVLTVGAVLFTKGERYYMLTGPDRSVSLLPADVVEKMFCFEAQDVTVRDSD